MASKNSYDLKELNDSLKDKVIENEKNMSEKRLNMGIIGIIFGDTSYAPTNIVGLLLFILFIAIGFILFNLQDSTTFTRKDFIQFASPILTTLIGFFAGNIVRKKE